MWGGIKKKKFTVPLLSLQYGGKSARPPASHLARVPRRRCDERVSLIVFADFLLHGFFAHFLRTYTQDYLIESLAHLLSNNSFPLSKNTLSSMKSYEKYLRKITLRGEKWLKMIKIDEFAPLANAPIDLLTFA